MAHTHQINLKDLIDRIKECKICYENKYVHVLCETCKHIICIDCAGKVSSCPFCRAKYIVNTPTNSNIESEYEDYSWWDRNTPQSVLDMRSRINFGVIRARLLETSD